MIVSGAGPSKGQTDRQGVLMSCSGQLKIHAVATVNSFDINDIMMTLYPISM